jgi:phosphoribosylformimino-5-aminoimidazole carboxamide ribotide isomerase
MGSMTWGVVPAVVIRAGRVLWPAPHPPRDGRRPPNPLQLGWEWRRAGARAVYVVSAEPPGARPLASAAAVLGLSALGWAVWVGGGIRDVATAKLYLGSGAEAVVVRALAREPDRLARLLQTVDADRVVVALEVRGGGVGGFGPYTDPALCLREWEQAGVRRFLIRALAPASEGWALDVPALRALARPGRRVVADGGVRSESDVRRLAEAGLDGVVIRQALYQESLSAEVFAIPAVRGG